MRKKQVLFLGAAMLLTACAKNPAGVSEGTDSQNPSEKQESVLTKSVSDNDVPAQDASDKQKHGKNVSDNNVEANAGTSEASDAEKDPESEESSLEEMTTDTDREMEKESTAAHKKTTEGTDVTTKNAADQSSVNKTTVDEATAEGQSQHLSAKASSADSGSAMTSATTKSKGDRKESTTASSAAAPTTAASTASTTAAQKATAAPTMAAPTTAAPTTAAPTTAVPTTAAPTTAAPTTAAPTTAAPTAAAKTLVSLECTYAETAYTGDTFDKNKLTVKAVYSDGTSEKVQGWSCNSFVFQQGVNNLTIEYGYFTQYTYLMAVDRPAVASSSTFTNGHHVYVQDYDTLGKKHYQEYISEINKQLQQVNGYRQAVGAPALVLDQTLCNVAGYRIAEMELESFYSHTHVIGGTDTGVLCMSEVAPLYGTTALAENISKGTGAISVNALGSMFADAFYNSEKHRANMENAAYTKIGIAISYDGNTFRCVQVFQ
jgi:uncharacterized protein YkwD